MEMEVMDCMDIEDRREWMSLTQEAMEPASEGYRNRGKDIQDCQIRQTDQTITPPIQIEPH